MREKLRNPILFSVLSILTLGLFAHIYTIYLLFRLRTFKSFVFRSFVGVFVICLVARFYELGFLTFFMVNWFTIPHYLEEKREFSNIDGEISWKLGLIPTIPVFYTVGFILFQAPFSRLADYTIVYLFGNFIRIAPTSELSEQTVYAIGIPMIITVIFGIGYWVYEVASKYKEYLDTRGEKLEEWFDDRETRKKQRNLMENIKPDKAEELPMFELDDFEVNKELNGKNEELSLEFDDDSDFM